MPRTRPESVSESPGALPFELLLAYSQGRLTRREIAERLDRPLGFGTLLAALHANGLPLPRFPGNPHSPGAELVRRLAEQAPRGR
jgi:hypothetical protein